MFLISVTSMYVIKFRLAANYFKPTKKIIMNNVTLSLIIDLCNKRHMNNNTVSQAEKIYTSMYTTMRQRRNLFHSTSIF